MTQNTPYTTRQTQLETELARFVRVLSADPMVEKIIVFGSLVSKSVKSESDIDIVIVQETSLKFFKRLKLAYQTLRPTIETDLLVYTPSEFAEMSQNRWFVKDEIVSKGRVIYQRYDTNVINFEN